MVRYPRKTNPGVRDGIVQKKNRTERSAHYTNYYQDVPVIDRKRPGAGYRHLIRKPGLVRFLGILPDWQELSKGLDAIVLAEGSSRADGRYRDGIIEISAWPREIAGPWDADHAEQHRQVLERLNVRWEPRGENSVFVHWTEVTARGYQLMHILLHELGHHYDRMTTKSQRESSRGEDFAEGYANRYADQLWRDYFLSFGG